MEHYQFKNIEFKNKQEIECVELKSPHATPDMRRMAENAYYTCELIRSLYEKETPRGELFHTEDVPVLASLAKEIISLGHAQTEETIKHFEKDPARYGIDEDADPEWRSGFRELNECEAYSYESAINEHARLKLLKIQFANCLHVDACEIGEYAPAAALALVKIDNCLESMSRDMNKQAIQYLSQAGSLLATASWIHDMHWFGQFQKARRKRSSGKKRSAALARWQPKQKAKEAVLKKYKSSSWKSAHSAARHIYPYAVDQAKKYGFRYSEYSFQQTVYRWLLEADGS